MWTPKRIVLLALSFFVYFSGYLLYASCLGGIDGLPPLPEADLPSDHPEKPIDLPPPQSLKLEDKLSQAFGADCPELKWALKMELNSKNLVVAAKDFKIEDDGRLHLDMISLAVFKDHGDGRGVEINTVRAKEAYLTFDKPLGKSDKDMGGRRIVAAELINDIEVVNNHRTPQRDDDLHLLVDKGPVYYDEARRLIWTEDNVHMEDDESQPPMDVRGRGLEVHLAAAEAPPARPDAKPGRGKPHNDAFTGVESIVLKADVDMHLWVSGGFLSDSSAKAPPTAAPAKQDKAELILYTPGRFDYEFHKDGDVAHFDALQGNPQPVSVDHITATPDGKGQLHDQLNCQHLELRMRPKDAAGPRDAQPADHGLEVESAHAVCLEEPGVVLASDSQKLIAHGFDFQYDAKNKLTILKGIPDKVDSEMSADQDGSLIHARELQIQDLPPGPDGKAARRVTAFGPGQIDLPDAKTKKRPIHASWQDKLISTKDGVQDLIVLTGTATFIDDEHDQNLQADTLKVWLAAPPEAAPTSNGSASPQDGHRPNHIEATGNVSVKSSDMTIPHTGQLVVWFRDAPPDALPGAAPAAKAAAPEAARPKPDQAMPPVPGPTVEEAAKAASPDPPASPAGVAAAPSDPPNADPAPPRPINLTARFVHAWVLRSGDKNQLQELQADGDVEVHQDPAKGDEKGVDVKGETLDMIYHPEGNLLVVTGDLAELQMDTIYIIGPEVNIDQASNKAWVNGAGAMQMKSETNFQGEKLDKPVPLIVHWNNEMFFNGRYAEFSDGVQAEQENAHLNCQSLQVFFDRAVSLKESNHGDPPPRVKNLVCYKDVRVDDVTLEGARVVRSQRIAAPSLTMNGIEADAVAPGQAPGSDGNEIRAPGPGNVRLYQVGGQDPLAAPAGPGAKVTAGKPDPAHPSKPDDRMKLTYVSYGGNTGGSMYVNTKTNTATFLENVRVLNMPCDNPNIEIDLDDLLNRLPEGAMYLRADRLDVFDHGDRKKSQQEMNAKGHVLVQAKDFWGRSNTMTYNEAKDQIIFEGGDGGVATLYKVKQQGAEPQKIEGKKITYIRSTGMFKIEGGEWISGN